MEKRLESLDGVRAIAILWVAIYHYAVFWTPAGKGLDLLPYGDLLAWIPLAAVGDLGVNLFFIVSGLVIALSLTRSSGLGQFAVRRVVRLWPALVVCATLTFLATSFLGPDDLRRSVNEFLISLTFVPPAHVGKAIGAGEMQWLDGAYWSLWVEVRFYLLAALIFFFGRGSFLRTWLRVAVICMGIHLLAVSGVGAADTVSRLLFAEYQPYFTAGIALACIMQQEDEGLAVTALLASVALALVYTVADLGWDVEAGVTRIWAVFGCFALAATAILRPAALGFLKWGPLTALGRASYGYYLLHQNLGIALLAALPLAGWWSVGAMLVIQAALIGLAFLLHAWVELPSIRAFRGLTRRRTLTEAVPVQRPRALHSS